jgi:hypothetical protein
MPDRELLGEKTLGQKGPWHAVRRWWRGVHAQRGIITSGLTGLETVEEKERFVPTHIVVVNDELPPTLKKPKAA